jgi:hypothetical protein
LQLLSAASGHPVLRATQRPGAGLPQDAKSKLVLGWAVDDNLRPKYWLTGSPKAGIQPESELVTCPAEVIAHHAIIVAQSGSGKSFFLGRLIEEILLQTKSRVLVLDPNADFRKFATTVPDSRWTDAAYDSAQEEGRLPHESARADFDGPWGEREKRVYSAALAAPWPMALDWLKFNVDWFSDDTDLAFQSELRHCHTFVSTLCDIFKIAKTDAWLDETELLEYGRRFCERTRGDSRKAILDRLESQFGPFSRKSSLYESDTFASATPDDFREALAPLLSQAALTRSFVSEPVERFYFSKAQEVKESGVFAKEFPVDPVPPARAHILDLPSIEKSPFRLMAVSHFLQEEWADARRNWETTLALQDPKDDRRVPLFVIADEAHNLVPHDSKERAHQRLRDQFRTIAAEGRKFGVFLILISQRPDKLDHLVISECENRAIMKIGSRPVLERSMELLGLDKPTREKAEKCLEFRRGRVLLCGPWAGDNAGFLFAAMRRTEEGGKDLPKEYWAVP